ncbi:MAG TPA: ATP-binding cassette domain-containing protein [Candidatus Acidoferrales bacterium]|nr:ATP-binding cassette domain-containing protein [Candidatus Acidoferrales bacterium]
MAEFQTFARWRQKGEESPALVEPAAAAAPPPVAQPAPARPDDELMEDICGRLRRFRALLDDLIELPMLGSAALGRAIDAEGNLLDAGAPSPARRRAIDAPLWTGVRCIDTLLTIGRGARVGIFGAPGAGKSTLLETIARGTRADAIAIGLVGERGREAQRWIASSDDRTTVICATSDRPALERVRAGEMLMMHAGALARRGLHVLVVLDSLARYANALREVAVERGESVGRGGFPPSVFARIAQLVERAGAFQFGSITLLATVLNDGDDHDPVSESARSLLDGHLQLSPRLAQAGRFPAIDVLASASRTMDAVVAPGHLAAAAAVRAALARLERSEDARSLGIEPVDAATRVAIDAEEALEALLRQGREPVAPAAALEALRRIADTLGVPHGHH